jgi:hypothetical protein
VPTLLGLLAIPVIVHPIDNAVHYLLNKSLRPYMAGRICDGAGGREAGLAICVINPVAGMQFPFFCRYPDLCTVDRLSCTALLPSDVDSYVN